MTVVQHWNRLNREVVECSTLEIFTLDWTGHSPWATLSGHPCFEQEVPPNLSSSVIHNFVVQIIHIWVVEKRSFLLFTRGTVKFSFSLCTASGSNLLAIRHLKSVFILSNCLWRFEIWVRLICKIWFLFPLQSSLSQKCRWINSVF